MVMYNQERKAAFLQYKKDTTNLSRNIETCFNDAEFFERRYEKDLCDWSPSEIIGYLKYLNSSKLNTLTVLTNMLRIYTDWCISNSLVKDNQNHYYEISTEVLCNCIDKEKLKAKIMSSEYLHGLLDRLYNWSDKFIFLSAFEGMKTSDIGNTKLSDVTDDHEHIQLEGREIPISEKLYDIIRMADMEVDYISYRTQEPKSVVPRPELVRPTSSSDSNPTVIVGLHYKYCCEHLGIRGKYTLGDIRDSGRIEYIREIMRETGQTIEEVLFDTINNPIIQIYGMPNNVTAYIYLYKDIIKEGL